MDTEHAATITITTWGADQCHSCGNFVGNIELLTFLRTSYTVRLCPACLKALSHLIALELK